MYASVAMHLPMADVPQSLIAASGNVRLRTETIDSHVHTLAARHEPCAEDMSLVQQFVMRIPSACG